MTSRPPKLSVLVASITYRPEPGPLRQLCQQLHAVGQEAVIFDNTDTVDGRQVVKEACKDAGIRVISIGCNVGLSRALNCLISEADSKGADWLQYFDQDSQILKDADDTFKHVPDVPEAIALVGSTFEGKNSKHRRESESESNKQSRFVIASGTAMRVRAIIDAGGFDESFFIDCVDHEMCFRLRELGWGICVDARRRLLHEIGSGSRQLWPGLLITQHPMWRRREMWRNSVVLVKRYATSFPTDCLTHLLARTAETVCASVVFRDTGYVREGAIGAIAGMRAPVRRGLVHERTSARTLQLS